MGHTYREVAITEGSLKVALVISGRCGRRGLHNAQGRENYFTAAVSDRRRSGGTPTRALASVTRVLALVARSGFASLNADLMFALPGQTEDDVTSDLACAASTGLSGCPFGDSSEATSRATPR